MHRSAFEWKLDRSLLFLVIFLSVFLSDCIFHGDGRVRYDLVHSYDKLFVTKKWDYTNSWDSRGIPISQSIPVPSRFNVVKLVVDTGQSKFDILI